VSADTYTGHIILCGLDELGVRTLEELHRLGERVVVVARRPAEEFAALARALGVPLLEGSYHDEAVLRAAGICTASAIVIAEDDDVGNLHAALAAQDLNPRMRIVMRVASQDLGDRVQGLFPDCRALSRTAIAAPAFVSAALHHSWEQRVEIAGRVLTIEEADAGEPHVLLPLAGDPEAAAPALFPESGRNLLCLVDEAQDPHPGEPNLAAQTPRRPHPSRLDHVRSYWTLLTSDQRIRLLLALLATLVLVSAVLFHRVLGLAPVTALYFTVTVVTTTGFGDITLRNAPAPLQVYGASLMLLGATLLTLFLAFVTDAIIGARLAGAGVAMTQRLRGHVVVCGLGNVGYRVVEEIASLGLPVAATEIDSDAPFVAAARRLGVPTLIEDARASETLRSLHVDTARCLVVATNDDVANLETALNALALNPDLRVVLRLFDPDLAARVERTFGIHISRSVSGLAAPAFATAAIGERIIATTSAGTRVLVFAQLDVEAGSGVENTTVGALEGGAEARVIFLRCGGRDVWRPAAGTVLRAGDELVVVATRSGVASVFDAAEAVPARRPEAAPIPSSVGTDSGSA
jgi:Trk K+ transport system NAD-binding subunit